MRVVAVLHTAGFAGFFAGGCVRDELLGRRPEDYDVATDATPERIVKLFDRTAEVGAHFGVVLVRDGQETTEVATFRTDGTYSDKRRPDSVRFSTAEEDAARRDFTVNALFLDPTGRTAGAAAPSGGTIIDYVGGTQDLAAKIIRAVGDADKRLAEDDLRSLRAARLAAKLGFEIEPGTAAAIRRHSAGLSGVSRERIGDEVRRMMGHESRATAARWMWELGLVAAALGCAAPAGECSTRHLAGLPAESGSTVAMAAWSLDLGFGHEGEGARKTAQGWRRALCLSNEEKDELQATLSELANLEKDWAGQSVAVQKRHAARGGFEAAMMLLEIRSPALAQDVRSKLGWLASFGGGIAPKPLVTGDHLIEMGMKPGPAFKRVLDGVYDAQLEGRVTNLREGLELARGFGVS
ncbi:MAG: CCA tRNA nucleotidyltransferase [Planctomycetes bacterium]|nr:CCA tRNA nucleotidyltransferase [Planctomycetota bacterium]